MKNVFITAATIAAFVGTATTATAAGHLDPETLTCAEFSALEISDQDDMAMAIATASEERDSEELTAGDVEVLCNGNEEDTVLSILDLGTE